MLSLSTTLWHVLSIIPPAARLVRALLSNEIGSVLVTSQSWKPLRVLLKELSSHVWLDEIIEFAA